MKRIFIVTYNRYLFYITTWISNEITIQTILDKDFLKILTNIVVGCDENSIINLRTIFESGLGIRALKNLFLVHDISFYNDDPNVLDLFQGYLFKSTCPFNMSIIKPVLWHILNIIFHHNRDQYSCIINSILYLIQEPLSTTEIVLVIFGEQGTDKKSSLPVFFRSYSDVMQYQMKTKSAKLAIDSIVLLRIKYSSSLMGINQLKTKNISTLIVSNHW
jgi:hypothetical protein